MEAGEKENAIRKLRRVKKALKTSGDDPRRLKKVRKAIRRLREGEEGA